MLSFPFFKSAPRALPIPPTPAPRPPETLETLPLGTLAGRCQRLVRSIQRQEAELREMEAVLAQRAMGQTVETMAGAVKVTEHVHIQVHDLNAVAGVLGEGFSEHVEAQVDYLLSPEVEALALDPDNPVGAALRGGLHISREPAVIYLEGPDPLAAYKLCP